MVENSDSKWAQLHIWDTLGQEKFKALAPIFYRKSVGAFLVYDVTSRKSFEDVDEWYQ
jgi:GTPase SAR1 family protein